MRDLEPRFPGLDRHLGPPQRPDQHQSCSCLRTQVPRLNPNNRQDPTSAQASSPTSRRSVLIIISPGSGRPPGRPHVSPLVPTRTTWSPATQIAAAPCGVPAGGFGGGNQATRQSCPFWEKRDVDAVHRDVIHPRPAREDGGRSSAARFPACLAGASLSGSPRPGRSGSRCAAGHPAKGVVRRSAERRGVAATARTAGTPRPPDDCPTGPAVPPGTRRRNISTPSPRPAPAQAEPTPDSPPRDDQGRTAATMPPFVPSVRSCDIHTALTRSTSRPRPIPEAQHQAAAGSTRFVSRETPACC